MNKTQIMSLLKIVNDKKLTSAQKEYEMGVALQQMLHLENAKQKGSTYKKQYQQAMKFLKGISNSRPVLKFVDYQEGYQVFTNSHVLFKMKNHIEGLPFHDNENGVYPEVLSFVPNKSHAENITDQFNHVDVLNKCDLMKIDKVAIPRCEKYLLQLKDAYLNPIYVKLVLDVLGVDNSKIEVYYQGNLRPIMFLNELGDEAVVVPVRFGD